MRSRNLIPGIIVKTFFISKYILPSELLAVAAVKYYNALPVSHYIMTII